MRWRVVLDTMVWAQAAINPTGPAGEIVELGRSGKLTLLTSTYVRDELFDTFRDPYFARELAEDFDATGWFTTVLGAGAELLEVTGPAVLVDNTKDDPILWIAGAGLASHVVSRDARILNLKTYRHAQILTPPAFLREWRVPKVSEPLSAWKAAMREFRRR